MATEYHTDTLTPPGDLLAAEIETRGWSQGEFARRLGCNRQMVTDVLHARRAITPEFAQSLSEVLGTSATVWLNLEHTYRDALLRLPAKRAAG